MCAVNEVSKARQDKEQGFSNNISSVNVAFYSYTQRAGEDVSGLNILTTVHSSLQRGNSSSVRFGNTGVHFEKQFPLGRVGGLAGCLSSLSALVESMFYKQQLAAWEPA